MEFGNASKFQVPGFQILSPNNFNPSDETAFNQSGSDLTSSWSSSSIINKCNISTLNFQLHKLYDWRVNRSDDDLCTTNDNFVKVTSHNNDQGVNKMQKMNQLVNLVFSELPFDDVNNFVEEFQYTIITSQLLNNESFYPNFHMLSMKKSILNFHKKSTQFVKSFTFVPTKYGRLIVRGKQYYLQKTIPLLRTILFTFTCLRKIQTKNSKNCNKKKIVIVLLISIYLALQQEYFYLKYLKYAALINLKLTLESLQTLGKLMHRFHLYYKELTIYRSIVLTKQATYTSNIDSKLHTTMVTEILNSSIDIFYYKLHAIIIDLLSVINTDNVSNYCGIYNVELIQLYQMITNLGSYDIHEKLNRVLLLQKFMLCCLLSINQFKYCNNIDIRILLRKIFPNFNADIKWINDKVKFITISRALKSLNMCLLQLISNLNFYWQSFHCLELSENEQEDHKHTNYKINLTLNRLREIQKELLSQEFVTDELSDFINKELEELLKTWKIRQIKKQNEKQLRHTHHRNISGITLDVVKPSDTDSLINKTKSTQFQTSLSAPVDFISVEDTSAHLELDNNKINEEQIYGSDTNDSTYAFKESLKKLTDEELRLKLNERIMDLAFENKKSRSKIVKQKSFELLNNSNHENSEESRSLCISEESIPVLYELNQLLNQPKEK